MFYFFKTEKVKRNAGLPLLARQGRAALCLGDALSVHWHGAWGGCQWAGHGYRGRRPEPLTKLRAFFLAPHFLYGGGGGSPGPTQGLALGSLHPNLRRAVSTPSMGLNSPNFAPRQLPRACVSLMLEARFRQDPPNNGRPVHKHPDGMFFLTKTGHHVLYESCNLPWGSRHSRTTLVLLAMDVAWSHSQFHTIMCFQ